jgi:hypothetical protein
MGDEVSSLRREEKEEEAAAGGITSAGSHTSQSVNWGKERKRER